MKWYHIIPWFQELKTFPPDTPLFCNVPCHIKPCGLFNTKSYLHTHTHTHTYIHIYISSCHAISTDILDSLSPLLPIIHCYEQILRATSHIGTELLYVISSWSSCLCTSMWRGPQEYITYELNPISPAVSRMSVSSNLDSFCDGW